MAWRLAKSLQQLLHEANEFAPIREKGRDGTIGDPAHAARASRHNPNVHGVVCALDITHSPAFGMDVPALARRIARHPHPNLDYIVSNGEKASRRSGWLWTPYRGSNPHAGHAHFAVGGGPDSEPTPPYDDTTPWGVAPVPAPTPEGDDMTEEQDRLLRELKVSSVAQSYELKWLRGKANGWAKDELDQVDADKTEAVAAKRKELGLDK